MTSECLQVSPPKPLQTKINIEELVKTNIPMMPTSIGRITSLLNNVNVSSRQLTEAIKYDPMLTARLLRLANSPIYSLRKNVTALQQAIEVVGLNSIYEILMLGLAADSFSKEIRDSQEGLMIWEHSLAVALLSRELSLILGLRGTEEAFICGLLHDIGKILLLRNDFANSSMSFQKNNETEMLHTESALFGYNHTQIGSLVASRWGLPEAVCYTILNHHNPSQCEHFLAMVHLVCAADMIANANGCGLREVDSANLAETESAILLKLSEEQMATAWERTAENLSEIKTVFT